jgi:hypothetical protein
MFSVAIWILVYVVAFLVLWLGFWSLVSFLVNRSRYHKKFIEGRAPQTPPEGFYQGTAHILFDKPVPWLGKSFDSANQLGFNVFTPFGAKVLKVMTPLYKRFGVNKDGNIDAYYFKTRTGAGLKDPQKNVIKLDYDSKGNPVLIRIILDEIVEVAPEQFLGKIHLKVFPRFYSTIGYFSLKKA